MIELLISAYNFKFQLRQALSQITSDDQIIRKIHTNLILQIVRLSIDLLQHCILAAHSSFSINFIPSHLYLLQSLIKNIANIVAEIDKYIKFNGFLSNLNNDYPLVHFGV